MKCRNCNRASAAVLTCSQCGNEYCPGCQEHWDIERAWCSNCQEQETIFILSESKYTQQLRKKFTKPIKVSPPSVKCGLPWSADRNLLLSVDNLVVGKFMHGRDCEHAAKSATDYHDLLVILAAIHERIRTGRQWYDGSEIDIALWSRLKELTKQ